jgi:hypothetical protein
MILRPSIFQFSLSSSSSIPGSHVFPCRYHKLLLLPHLHLQLHQLQCKHLLNSPRACAFLLPLSRVSRAPPQHTRTTRYSGTRLPLVHIYRLHWSYIVVGWCAGELAAAVSCYLHGGSVQHPPGYLAGRRRGQRSVVRRGRGRWGPLDVGSNGAHEGADCQPPAVPYPPLRLHRMPQGMWIIHVEQDLETPC